MNKDRELFEKTPVPKALAILAIPTIISQLITMIYNLADTVFIGLANDESMTAAASLSFMLVFMMNCVSNLFGVGGGSLISRLLGERKDKDATRVAAFSFWGSIATAIIYSLLIYLFMDPVLRLLGATDGSIGYARDYALWVIVIGGAMTTAAVTMSHLLRSEGHAKAAGLGLGLGGLLNIALDPLFMFVIFEPGCEVLGAAVATFISNVAVFVFFLAVYLRLGKKTVLSISLAKVDLGKRYVKSVFSVGFPSALGTFFACLSGIVLNGLASGYYEAFGDSPVASIGIAKKIDMLPMNVGMGLCQGMMPLVAYNYASKDYKRMRDFARCARIIGIGFSVLCIVMFESLAPYLVSAFIREEETVEMATDFLRIFCLPVPLMITNFQMAFTFQAMGKGKQSLLLSSLRQGLVNIPLLFLMNYTLGLYGLVWAQPISEVTTTAISFIIYHYTMKRLDAEIDGKLPIKQA